MPHNSNDCVQRALRGLCNAGQGNGIKGCREPCAVLAAPNCSLQGFFQLSHSQHLLMPLSAGLTDSRWPDPGAGADAGLLL